MNRCPSIVAVSGDPGGAEAVAPVLSAIERGNFKLHAFAYHQAGTIFAGRGLAQRTLPVETTEAQCGAILEECGADLLLVSTSMNGVNLERTFTAAAQRSGIPSLAILDFWANYRQRFLDPAGEMTLVPDRIAVMDERGRREMLAEGFEPERLVVTGQPALEDIAAWRTKAPPGIRERLRGDLGIADTDLLVVFGSQPLARVAEHCGRESDWLGYTERTVIPMLITALEEVARASGRRIILLVRPHPRESVTDYAEFTSSQIRVLVSATENRREVALAADLVAGMNSAFLTEACYLECVTASLQPGLRQPEAQPTVLAGWTAAIYDANEMHSTLERLLLDPASCPAVQRMRQELQLPAGATERIIALIEEMLSTAKLHFTTH